MTSYTGPAALRDELLMLLGPSHPHDEGRPCGACAAYNLLAALPAPDPAPVEEAADSAAVLSIYADHDDYAVEVHVIRDAINALAARPGPSAQIPDEDLPGYRQPFTGPLGSRGDPTVALAVPSGEADAAWEALERLTRRHTDPLDKIERVNHGPAWMHVVGDPACFICAALALRAVAPSDGDRLDMGSDFQRTAEMRWRALEAIRDLVGDHDIHKPRRDDCAVCRFFIADARNEAGYQPGDSAKVMAALRAVAPSDGACPRCGRSGAALSCPDCNAEFRAPSDGAGGLDVERTHSEEPS